MATALGEQTDAPWHRAGKLRSVGGATAKRQAPWFARFKARLAAL